LKIKYYTSNFYSDECRFGFNGKENDNEVKGYGNQQNYGMRIYDPRIGKFLSVDPLFKSYPWYTPYQFAGNKPISSIDMDGLEDVDYRVVFKYDDGSALVKVSRSDASTSNSHDGNLRIHNKDDGKTYTNFEWNELNTLFGIDENTSDISNKVNSAGPAGPGSYSFRLSDPSDIIKADRFNINADGTKNVLSFSAIVSKERTVTPWNGAGGSISSVASSTESNQIFLFDKAKEIINPNQAAFGQTSDDVTVINISVGTDEYKSINNPSFIGKLQNSYKNATINISEGNSSTGYSIEYKGKEAKQQPVPLSE